MKNTVLRRTTEVGHLINLIIDENWPMRLGDWREVDERCARLVEVASWESDIRHLKGSSVKARLRRNGLIIYDNDSGLWYCQITGPKQDYPDGWRSEAGIERDKTRAVRDAFIGPRCHWAWLKKQLRKQSNPPENLCHLPGSREPIVIDKRLKVK